MKLILALLLSLSLYANAKQDMFTLYQNKNFEKACKLGFKNFTKNKKDEEYISLYALSCLHADFIDRLAIPISILRYSKEARANAAYFSVILMQKKLLYHAMLDDYDISSLNLPSTNFILSKVFDLYAELGKHKKRDFYIFTDKQDPRLKYKLYIIEEKSVRKIIIEEYYDNISIKRHVYW